MEKYFYFCMFVCTSSLCKSCEQFWKECCDCFYHEKLVEKLSGRELLPNENSKDVVEIENSQVIKNSKEVPKNSLTQIMTNINCKKKTFYRSWEYWGEPASTSL